MPVALVGMIGLYGVRVPSGSCPSLLVLVRMQLKCRVSRLSGLVGVESPFALGLKIFVR